MIEPAAGLGRTVLALLCDAYDTDEIGGEKRTVLRLHPSVAPVKVAVLPLLRKDGHPEKAREIYEALRKRMSAEYDEGGHIGKRYRRQDEIGTPFGVTIDHQTLEDDTVTLRDRDTLTQERVAGRRDRGPARRACDEPHVVARAAGVGSGLCPPPQPRSPTRISTRAGSAGNWRATEIDFTEDRRHWHEVMTPLERRAALWQYAMFFHGEDAVADDLAPFIDAAPREEQKYFLCTQQVDEARHAIFFKRFMNEVVGRGDASIAGTLQAVEPELTWGFRKTFALLDEITGALRTDRSRRRARAGGDDVPRRRRGAAGPARPALHLRLPREAASCCPASARACGRWRWTSSATSASA